MLSDYFVTLFLGSLFGIFLLYVLVKTKLRWRAYTNLPPGPTYIPILGTFNALLDSPFAILTQLPVKYGPIVSLPRDGQNLIILSSSAAVYDAFDRSRRNDFDERERTDLNGWNSGLFMKNPPQWTVNRKQTIRLLYQYGMQLQGLDLLIADEMDKMRAEWDKSVSVGGQQPPKTINPRLDFNVFALNLTGRVIFSRSTAYGNHHHQQQNSDSSSRRRRRSSTSVVDLDQQKFRKMLLAASHAMTVTLEGQFNVFFTHRQWLPKHWLLQREIRKTRRDVDHYVQEIYAQHMSALNSSSDTGGNDEPSDLTDHLCQEEQQIENKAERSKFRNNAVEILTDLFEAALDITPAMAYWLGFFLIRYPHEQQRIRSEVLALSEEGAAQPRPPTLSDYQRLPYTRAFIYEAMRVSNIILQYPGHVAVRDTQICGYDVPRGSAVFINVLYLHSSADEYEQPKQFRTSRFLTEKGEFVGTSRKLFTFGHGARSCIGEDVALKILTMMTALMVYYYELYVPEGQENSLPDVNDPLVKGIAQCRDYEFAIKKRHV